MNGPYEDAYRYKMRQVASNTKNVHVGRCSPFSAVGCNTDTKAAPVEVS